MKPTFVRFAAASILGLAGLALTTTRDGAAQEPKGEGKAGVIRQVYSAHHCIGCHGGETLSPAQFREFKKESVDKFIKLNEYETWLQQDLHASAWENITPKVDPDGKPNLAARMQAILGQSPDRGKDYKVAAAAECLTCHAVDLQPGRVKGPREPAGDRFQTSNGVSCESCHGFAENWFGPHTLKTWRDKGPNAKTGLGLVDLRDPYTKAMKCASCHVGNKDEGKFVTHEMYAAGHPPLPPFELERYAEDQPRHYHASAKNEYLNSLDADAARKLFHHAKADVESAPARNLAFGTVAAFEATMRLLATDASDTAKLDGETLDFAHFDCYACHHDLKVNSDRQNRGYRGVPGRPTMRPWATETLKVVLGHAESGEGVETEKVTAAFKSIREGLADLNKSFDARPFGKPDEIGKKALALAEACKSIQPLMGPLVYSPVRTKILYDRLAARVTELEKLGGKPGPDGLYLDHDAAQQVAWALVTLQSEVGGAAPGDTWNKLDAVTRLKLRGANRETVESRLKTRLDQLYGFEAKPFLSAAGGLIRSFERK